MKIRQKWNVWGVAVLTLLGMCGCQKKDPSLDQLLLEQSQYTMSTESEESKKDWLDESNEVSTEETGEDVKTLWVHICGYVQNPGIYEMPVESRLYDCVMAAGGFTDGADKEALNLANYMSDATQIYVPGLEENLQNKAEITGKSEMDLCSETDLANEKEGLININTASQSLLETLPGIGQSKAKDIIAYRKEKGPFLAIEDITNVSGIKDAVFSKIKDLITVED